MNIRMGKIATAMAAVAVTAGVAVGLNAAGGNLGGAVASESQDVTVSDG